jgi:uncharacterized protein YjiS (DUF1127 family)
MSQTASLSNETDAQVAVDQMPFLRYLIAKVMTAWAAWIAWRIQRYDAARLYAMDDRMLADIGLTRSEIGHVVRFGRGGDGR